MTLAALGDSAVVVTLGDGAGKAVLAQVRALASAIEEARIPGVTDVVPAYATVAVFYDRVPAVPEPSFDGICRAISACAPSARPTVRRLRGRLRRKRGAAPLVEIPVCYGGEFGPDLPTVADHARMDPARVVALHGKADYSVQAIGFSPGFPYLAGLPDALRTPRRPTPRTAVPAGSVGIGGAQTGVYPLEGPGGWQLIGRTPLPLFRPREKSPSLLRVGDRVRFRAVEEEEFRRLEREGRAQGDQALEIPASNEDGPGVRVIRPGLLTTVQDLGRFGHRAAGIPAGGAMDPFALRVANLLAGNAETAAGLEITLLGPELEFSADVTAAVTGAQFDGIPAWRPFPVRAGERLKFGASRRGCRAYLAISGGIDVPEVLGGRGTFLRAGLGGLEGRALREGDRLPLSRGRLPSVAHQAGWQVSTTILPDYSQAPVLRAVRGPQAEEFGPEFWDAEFNVSPQSDRMGLRLAGPPLARRNGRELASTAAAPGTVQVPPDGQPIVLGADAQTIGGYPQAAHVIRCDLPVAAQLRPGDRVRFREVSLPEARALARIRERDLGILRAGLARFS